MILHKSRQNKNRNLKNKKMNIVRRNPDWLAPTTIDTFFDKFFNESAQRNTSTFSPRVDIAETDKAFEVHLAVPGFKKEDFTIDLKDGKLIISGERKFEKESKVKNYFAIQTEFGKFTKSFQLPDSIDEKGIEAKYESGILEIIIPKDETKKIESKILVK
jgi:HSP20 family protein